MAERYGLLVDYTYFSGNHAAEIACKEEMGLELNQWGIKEVEVGPFKKGPGNDGVDWEWFYLPIPTSLFSERWGDGPKKEGERPLAVQVEESATLTYGPLSELCEKLMGMDRRACLFRL